MTTTSAAANPFHGLVDEASATLRKCLVVEGLTDEAPAVLPSFERAVRTAVTVVEESASGVSDDLMRDFALAYLMGRIAKEQVFALQHACDLASAARTRAEQHWRAALAAERRHLALEPLTLGSKPVESVYGSSGIGGRIVGKPHGCRAI